MDDKYTYNHSFEVSLIKCGSCGVYYNRSTEHTCTKEKSSQQIDIIEQIRDNLTKVKPRKQK